MSDSRVGKVPTPQLRRFDLLVKRLERVCGDQPPPMLPGEVQVRQEFFRGVQQWPEAWGKRGGKILETSCSGAERWAGWDKAVGALRDEQEQAAHEMREPSLPRRAREYLGHRLS